jgi:UDP-glucuronate 4-epimerase
MQPGDVPASWADIEYTKERLEWHPNMSIELGIEHLTKWYLEYINSNNHVLN